MSHSFVPFALHVSCCAVPLRRVCPRPLPLQMDDFIAAYPGLPINMVLPSGELEYRLPPRGVLVGLFARCRQLFRWDASNHSLSLV